MKKNKVKASVIEKYLLGNPQWQSGYKTFARQLAVKLAWIFIIDDENRLVRLDRNGGIAAKQSRDEKVNRVAEELMQLGRKWSQEYRKGDGFYKAITVPFDIQAHAISIQHFNRLKAVLFACSFCPIDAEKHNSATLFQHFLSSQVELAYKNFELNNFYETVHPRALALSTMHSVHRVISSSLRLHDLLPRIGRLSAQVLKAKGCSIMLVDSSGNYLTPYFNFGGDSKFVYTQRIKVGRGLPGKIAATGQFHLSRHSIAVPFIEDDVVGVIALWDKIDQKSFTKIDLEILKSLSEQAVVAIKNAQLYEETEQLTLGSIKTINELLEVTFGGDRSQMNIFRKIVIEVAKELELSTREQTHLQRAIMLLDAGALAMPDKIFRKKGKLTKKEYAQVKRIPARGANLLRSITSLKPITPIILHQHERYDGKGYPQGLAGDEIPIGARIVSVVNSFIAMVSERSYRTQMAVNEAIKEIQSNQGSQFDPKVVQAFIKVMKRQDVIGTVNKIKGLVRKKRAKRQKIKKG